MKLGATIFGRYYAADSPVHRMDPRAKLIVALIYMVSAVLAVDMVGVAILAVFTLIAIRASHIPLREVYNSIKPLLFILIFTIILNVFTVNEGTVYWHWGTFTISSGGFRHAVIFTLRVGLMLFGASLLTLTTTTLELTDGIESLLAPLSRIGFPSHEIAMMTSIALRFLPTFLDEGIKIKRAQESRGATFDEGSIIQRTKMLVPLLSPLFASAFRHADELSMAMESRCYHGSEGRTKTHALKMGRNDYIAFAIISVMVILLIIVRLQITGDVGHPA
ncbi:MAG: energy-coupling factor transporter transmembrane protein EcfT [Coriobacteriales bacterium]|nr:energy-coupling factor transporter transmembrane protein EcfT [Coriobacteriales bacterium]